MQPHKLSSAPSNTPELLQPARKRARPKKTVSRLDKESVIWPPPAPSVPPARPPAVPPPSLVARTPHGAGFGLTSMPPPGPAHDPAVLSPLYLYPPPSALWPMQGPLFSPNAFAPVTQAPPVAVPAWPTTPMFCRGMSISSWDTFAASQWPPPATRLSPSPPSSPLPWGLAPLDRTGKPEASSSSARPKATPLQSDDKKRGMRSFDDRFAETARLLPAYGDAAMALLQRTRHHSRPTLRAQVAERWIVMPLQEQIALFAPRPWAQFVWLAFVAFTYEKKSLDQLCKNHSVFYRQAQAYFVVGGSNGLQQFLDLYHARNQLKAVRRKSMDTECLQDWHRSLTASGWPLESFDHIC